MRVSRLRHAARLCFSLFVVSILFFLSGCAMKGAAPAAIDSAHRAEKKVVADETGDRALLAPEAMAEAPSAAPAMSARKSGAKPGGASGLKAGYADDNKQFNYFINFLERYAGQAPHYPVNIQERIVLKVLDANGKPAPNAEVSIKAGNSLLQKGRTYSDGTFLFFPSEQGKDIFRYRASITVLQRTRELDIDRQGPRDIEVRLEQQRAVPDPLPLDVLFVLDTTGSMGEEIARLKKTIELINLNLSSLPSKTQVRFGMVLYRDRGDEYVTRTVPLTGDLEKFQQALNTVQANGGGDGPEDLQSALQEAVTGINWNQEGIRIAFVITDAQPHLDYGQQYTYVDAVQEAKRRGIKIFSVGTGGLNIAGEYVLRQVAQYTLGRYIFLTYGEKGESEGGSPGSVSHHTGDNFQTDKLEAIIIRFAKEEIANVQGEKIADDGEYFEAAKREDESKSDTLQKLFDQAVSQLIDYSSIAVAGKTPAAMAPLSAKTVDLSANTEYFGEQLVLSLSRNKTFTMVERKDLQAILEELKLQMTGIVSEKDAAKVGRMLGAKMMITGTLYGNEKYYELFLKLLRVESGEVLSVTKARINKELGL